jgi:hypothetical protein
MIGGNAQQNISVRVVKSDAAKSELFFRIVGLGLSLNSLLLSGVRLFSSYCGWVRVPDDKANFGGSESLHCLIRRCIARTFEKKVRIQIVTVRFL